MNDDIMALADRLLKIEARLDALEDERESTTVVEPVPEWRRLVDAADGDPDCRPYDSPLVSVLDHLTTLAFEDLSAEGRKAALARIVAVCEAQVMGGWQADPERSLGRFPGTAWGLTKALATSGGGQSEPDREDWEALASDAAAWLRDLTEADA